jgi:alcohol dehydrogenase class IV
MIAGRVSSDRTAIPAFIRERRSAYRYPLADAAEALLAEIRALVAELDVPGPSDLGIGADRWTAVLGTMAEQALASGSPSNNPRVPTREEIERLYIACYS